MTDFCTNIRTRLAALADAARVPADLAAHLQACPGCAHYAQTLVRVDRLIPHIPVPASSPTARANTKAILLAAADTPIIRPRPAAPATPSGIVRIARATWAVRESWQYAGGVAAVLAVGVSLWWLGTQPRPEVAGPRHELLTAQVQSLARLATAETAQARVSVWADVIAELAAETKRVHAGAAPDDFAALDRMFTTAVENGLLTQAKNLPPNLTIPERRAQLQVARDRLAATQAAAEAEAALAPVQAVNTWKKLAKTAADGQHALALLTRPEA